MREIKFRAWASSAGRMMSYEEVQDAKLSFINSSDDKRHEWMQFTGLTDKNGKEIWEGDVVRIRSLYETDEPVDTKASVLFRDGSFRTTFHDGVINEGFCEGKHNWNVEVIGNIWETPSLLDV